MTLEGAIAVTRFGLGARAGEIEIASQNPKKWLKDQLGQGSLNEPYFGGLPKSHNYIEAIADLKAAKRAEDDDALKLKLSQGYLKKYRGWKQAEDTSRFHCGAKTITPFAERLVHFWSNHFSISGQTREALTAAAHEREVIRPHIMGTFRDLAKSAILHPSMLIYLDNVKSIGPNSITGRVGRFIQKGLNENLAREVMELHTVTPASGYNQSDVTEFARALTGWTIAARKEPKVTRGQTFFNARRHEPGSRTVMGKTYFPIGKQQAIAIINNLCSHPNTAKNIAYKLARHFIADVPPQSLIDRLTSEFLKTGGDLKALYSILIDAPELWTTAAQKVKTPNEMLVSAARYMGTKEVFPTWPRDVFEGFGQTPYKAPSPEGWPDTTDAWIGPDSMMKRIEWANKVAQRNSKLDAREFLKSAIGPRSS